MTVWDVVHGAAQAPWWLGPTFIVVALVAIGWIFGGDRD